MAEVGVLGEGISVKRFKKARKKSISVAQMKRNKKKRNNIRKHKRR